MHPATSRWAVALRGALAVVAGLFFIFYPVRSVAALVVIFGVFAITAGTFAAIDAVVSLIKKQGGWTHLLEGVLGITAGVVVFAWPAITAAIFLLVIGIWAVIIGLADLVLGVRARALPGSPMLAASGAFTLLFGIVLLIAPTASMVAISWMLGIFLLAVGCVQLALGLAVRPLMRQAV